MRNFIRKASAFYSYPLVRVLTRKTRKEREVILSKFLEENMERPIFIEHYNSLASRWNRFKLASLWIEKEERTKEDFEEVLLLLDDKEDFEEVLLLLGDEQIKSDLVRTWLEKEGRTGADFVAILPFVADPDTKSSIASTWLKTVGRVGADFVAVLPLLSNESNALNLAIMWLQKSEATREDLVAFLPLFSDESDKSFLAIMCWLQKTEATREDLVAVLPLLSNEYHKLILAKIWLQKSEATKEDLVAFLPLLRDESDKINLAETWLQKSEATREDFVAVLPLLSDKYHKLILAIICLQKSEATREDLEAVLSLFSDESDKSRLAKNWLQKTEATIEDLVAVLPLLSNETDKSSLAIMWLQKTEATIEDLVAVLPLFSDESYKSTLAKTWIKGQQDPDTVYSAFIELVKEDLICTRYNTEDISSIYLNLSLPPKNTAPINKIANLCKDLYPTNEIYQAMLFKNFVKKLHEDILTENKPVLISFIRGLNEDEFALESFRALDLRITIPPLEVLEISKNRFNRKYESIQEMLSNASREEAFNEIAARQSLVTQFGEDPPKEVSQASLCEIFSYYDFKGLIEEFRLILSPEFQEKITEEFSPSDKSPYISKEEFAKLKILFPEINLPEMSILGSFLKKEIDDRIPSGSLTEEKIAAFKFGESNVLKEPFLEFEQEPKENSSVTNSILEDLTAKFRELLSATEPEVKDVANFFAEVLDIKEEFGYTDRDAKKKREKQDKLTHFFKGNKILVAHLLERDGGLDQIKDAIRDIGDGCVANIATQFKSAVYRVALGEDFNLAALYGVFRDKISVPILNSGGDRLGGSSEGTDIFTYHLIANSRISPNGLVKALAEEFLGNGTENSSETISKKFPDQSHDILENILSEFPEEKDFNQKYAEIATYCVLDEIIPNLLEDRNFSKLKKIVDKCRIDTNQPPSTIVGRASVNSIAANSPLQPSPPGGRY